MEQSFYNLLYRTVDLLQKRGQRATISPEVWSEFCQNTLKCENVIEPDISSAPVVFETTKLTTPTLHNATLNDIAMEVKNCNLCELCKGRKNSVSGSGSSKSGLMFISEAPRAQEDIEGKPLVGEEGILLEKMIVAMNFSRDDVYITNVVKCRPANNREPSIEEAKRCLPYLYRQIELVRPRAIVCLGKVALSRLLGCEVNISEMRGKWLEYRGIAVMPTFHPAYLLRQTAAKRETWHDLQAVIRFLSQKF